jgi:hypothetical protein
MPSNRGFFFQIYVLWYQILHVKAIWKYKGITYVCRLSFLDSRLIKSVKLFSLFHALSEVFWQLRVLSFHGLNHTVDLLQSFCSFNSLFIFLRRKTSRCFKLLMYLSIVIGHKLFKFRRWLLSFSRFWPKFGFSKLLRVSENHIFHLRVVSYFK